MKYIWTAALMLALALTGCASRESSRTANILSHVRTIDAAEQIFGPPTSVFELAEGKTRYNWTFSRRAQVPGQVRERQVYMGHDRDGFPVYRTARGFVPAHDAVDSCHLSIVADRSGAILNVTREGGACDELLTPPGRPTLGEREAQYAR